MTAPSCRVCGRVLTSEASKAAGVGPTCRRRARGHTAPRPATSAHPTTNHHPGQGMFVLDPIPTAAINIIEATLTNNPARYPTDQATAIARDLTRHGWTITPTT